MDTLLHIDISIIGGENGASKFWEIGLPIITLILGAALDRVLDVFFERRRENRDGKKWIGELKYLATPVQKQIDQIDEFLDEHNKPVLESPELGITTQLKCETAKSLPKSSLQSYLSRNRFKLTKEQATTRANQIVSYFGIAETHLETVQEKFLEYKNNSSAQVNEFKLGLNEFLGAFSSIIRQLEKEGQNFKENEFLRQVDELFVAHLKPHLQTGNIPFFQVQDDFILPAIDLIVANIADDYTQEVGPSLKRCNMALNEINMEKGYLATNLGNVRGQLEGLRDSANGLAQNFN